MPFVVIKDNRQFLLITVNAKKSYVQQIEQIYFFFYKFHLILLCLIVSKMKKVVTNMSSAKVIISALRVILGIIIKHLLK